MSAHTVALRGEDDSFSGGLDASASLNLVVVVLGLDGAGKHGKTLMNHFKDLVLLAITTSTVPTIYFSSSLAPAPPPHVCFFPFV